MSQPESYNPERSLDSIGMSRREIMAEIPTGPGTESVPVGSQIGPARQFTREEVLANATLGAEERKQAAANLLLGEGKTLTEKQQQELIDAHKEASGELGKDNTNLAGVFNLITDQIRRKVSKLGSFSLGDRRKLFEAGLVGVLPSSEFDIFKLKAFIDPKLGRIAGKIIATGGAGHADEKFLYETSVLVKKLDDVAEVDAAEAQDILTQLEVWQTKADDPLLPYAERVNIEQQLSIERKSKSEFNMTVAFYEYYSSIDTNTLSPDFQTELQNRKDALRLKIKGLVDEARGEKILEDVDERNLSFYGQVKGARRREKYGGRAKQAIIDYERGSYHESFWKDSPKFIRLEKKFAGVAAYVHEGIVSEVDKETKGKESEPFNVVATTEFDRLKERRKITRAKEKKYETNPYYGQLNYELTAENAEELAPAVLDWVGDQIAELSKDPSLAGGQIDQIRQKTISMLEANRFYLDKEEGQDISPTHPDFLRARNIAEAVTDVLGNEMMLYKGGEDVGPQYKTRFASEFIAHHDAMVLENPYAAYIMHKLTKHRNGTYWLGQPLDSEKLQEGEIEDYRKMIEEEIKEDALTLELFITEEDFRKRKVVGSDNQERDLNYSFDDPIEKLLLDPGDVIRAQVVARGDPEALARHDLRTGVFRKIKARLDAQEQLAGLTPEVREQKIRLRIFQKMKEKTKLSYLSRLSQQALYKLADARASNDITAYDQAMWDWVRKYNEYRIKMRLPRWQPSGWDRVRMRIDRPTKVLDRALSEEEFEAMYEPIVLPAEYDYDKDIKTRKRTDDVRFGFQLARSYQIFTMQDTLQGGMRTRLIDIDTGLYTGRLMDGEASRLLGLIDQNGNITNPNRKLVRIFDIVQARLEAAITEEAVDIAQAKLAKAQAIASGNQDAIKVATKDLRDKMVNAQFLATHALKELGLVEGKLPVWSYNFLDDSTLDVFMKALAAYGVETSENILISHEDKGLFYEIVERGRRGLKAEWDRVTQEHMSTSYKVSARNLDGSIKIDPATGRPVQAKSLWRAADDFGVLDKDMKSRYRMVNKGAVAEDRKVTDTRFEQSTSGGVAVTELIPDLADLGFYPLLVWLGVTDIRGLHGYIHRRDETEFHKHRYFHVMDPVQHALSLGAAYKAIKGLTGGKIDEGTSSPGVLKEPFHGAFKGADWLHSQYVLAQSYGMEDIADYLAIMRQYRLYDKSYSKFLEMWTGKIPSVKNAAAIQKPVIGMDVERLRQKSYSDFDKMNKDMTDAFYTTIYGVLDYFQDYLKALKTVETSRRGRAPRNWEENNHLKWYAFRREIRAAIQGKKKKEIVAGVETGKEVWDRTPEEGFVLRLGYSPEITSEFSLRMMEAVLQDADYLILRSYEVKRRVLDGVDILSKVLTEGEKQAGFVIRDEKYWSNERLEVQKALKSLRRRGLLEFMREEGYNLLVDNVGEPIKGGDGRQLGKDVLGKKIPPLIQQEMVEQKNSNKVASVKP